MIYTAGSMKTLIRSLMNVSSTTTITDTEIYNALNDGYRDVAVKALCIEHEDVVTTTEDSNLVSWTGHKVNYVELLTIDEVIFVDTADTQFTDTTAVEWDDYETTFSNKNLGLIHILPAMVGHVKIDGTHPQYWFQWGNYLYIEPIPDDRYNLNLYISDYPTIPTYDTVAFSESADAPDDLPKEFHQCIVDFALYALSMKLNRWGEVAMHYNRYIGNLVARKKEYIEKRRDNRLTHELPHRVVNG